LRLKKTINLPVSDINRFFNNLNPAYTWIVLLLYVGCMVVITSFHEPWYDEAQSWLIARDASITDIIFKVPHFEGHPPLWHLYLVPFAKLGLPYEAGIKSASILLNAIAMGIMLFKAPFPRLYRFLIPFTYFFFYQYGVISRCYSLLILGFVLAGLTWKARDEKPFRFILSLMLVCASSAYGMLFAAGITLVWLADIIKKRKYPRSLKKAFSDSRLYALLLLLFFALAIAYLIVPNADTYAINLPNQNNSLLERLYFMLIAAPMEGFFYTGFNGWYYLHYLKFTADFYVISGLLFIPFVIIIAYFGMKKRKLALLIVPYLLFAVFSATVYFSSHHLGVAAAFFLFWFWACMAEKPDFEPTRSDQDAKKVINVLIIFSLLVSVYWTISACAADIRNNYDAARATADFIKEHKLEDRLIMSNWYVPGEDDPDGVPNPEQQDTPSINAYFDKNIFYSFNGGDKNISYGLHISPDKDTVSAVYKTWASCGAPDVLLGKPRLYEVFGDTVTYDDYALVAVIPEAKIVKAYENIYPVAFTIYLRKDLLDEYGLTEITDIDMSEYPWYR
jgi:hypothetical protein